MLRQKRKRRKSSVGKILSILILIAGAGYAAYAFNFLGFGDRMDTWLDGGFVSKPPGFSETSASALPEGALADPGSPAENAESESAAGEPPRAANGTETPRGAQAAEPSQAMEASGPPETPQRSEEWVRLAIVDAPDGTEGALREGARLRIELPAGGAFSYRQWRSSPEGEAVLSDTPVASLLFETALRTGLETGERHIHARLPAGVRAGFDVRVSEGRDLSFYNPYDFPVALIVTAGNGALAAEAVGQAPADWKAPEVSVSQPLVLEPERVELISVDGSQIGTIAGNPGMLVKVYVNGRLSHKDFYAPIPTRTLREPTEEERDAFRHDGSLS